MKNRINCQIEFHGEQRTAKSPNLKFTGRSRFLKQRENNSNITCYLYNLQVQKQAIIKIYSWPAGRIYWERMKPGLFSLLTVNYF